MIRARVTGARELAEVLLQLPNPVQRKVMVPAVSKGADVIRNAARRNLRRLGLVLTGRLVRNLRKRRGKTRDVVEFSVGPSRGGFYGIFAEFGTSRQRATPWLRPAVQSDGKKVVEVIGREIGRGVEREAAKLVRRR